MTDEQLPEQLSEDEAPEPDKELTVVFTTNDDSEALVVKGLLESSDLEVAMTTPEAPMGVFPISSSDLGRVRLLVRAEREDDARRIIEESQHQEESPQEESPQDAAPEK